MVQKNLIVSLFLFSSTFAFGGSKVSYNPLMVYSHEPAVIHGETAWKYCALYPFIKADNTFDAERAVLVKGTSRERIYSDAQISKLLGFPRNPAGELITITEIRSYLQKLYPTDSRVDRFKDMAHFVSELSADMIQTDPIKDRKESAGYFYEPQPIPFYDIADFSRTLVSQGLIEDRISQTPVKPQNGALEDWKNMTLYSLKAERNLNSFLQEWCK